jgi:Ankyrin repeat
LVDCTAQGALAPDYEYTDMALFPSGTRGLHLAAKCELFANALQAASAGGYEQVVKLLLKNGADVNAYSGEYGNAL